MFYWGVHLPRIYVYLDIDYSNVHLTYLYINPYRKIQIKKFNNTYKNHLHLTTRLTQLKSQHYSIDRASETILVSPTNYHYYYF